MVSLRGIDRPGVSTVVRERLRLAPEAIGLWLVFTDDIDGELLDAYRRLLSAEERARADRFHLARDRRTHLIARALVRTVLSRYGDIPPEAWRFTANRYGRPRLVPAQYAIAPISFNLSHATGMIALGVRARLAVGVDVEDTRRAAPEIATRYFAPDEAADLQRVDGAERHRRFFEYWTLKESYIKARGMGLSIPLDQFAFTLPGDTTLSLSTAATLHDDPARWRCWQLAPSAEHVLAVCATRSDEHETLVTRRTVPLGGDEPLDGIVRRDSLSRPSPMEAEAAPRR